MELYFKSVQASAPHFECYKFYTDLKDRWTKSRLEAIKRLKAGKETHGEIARSYNVSRWTISRLTRSDLRSDFMPHDFEYDVAFSFLAQDESVATELNDALCERVKRFFIPSGRNSLQGQMGRKLSMLFLVRNRPFRGCI